MPHITIDIVPDGHSEEELLRLAQTTQLGIAQTLGIDDRMVSVAIRKRNKREWERFIRSVPEETMAVKPGY